MFENLDKLQDLEDRYLDLEAKISDPEVIARQEEWLKYTKAHSKLTEIVTVYREYKKLVDAWKDDEAIAKAREDQELTAMAEEEMKELQPQLEAYEEKLTLLLLPKDPNDRKNVILEIRAGTGGEEAALFAASLLRMYTMYAAARGWRTDTVELNETELGGVKECSVLIEGEGAWSRLKFESGVHRVQRVPVTESNGRIQTSAATVAVLPEAEGVDVKLDPADIEMQVYRASGAGGQHVNKTSSAVRLIHRPTGLVVECQQERSQFQNKDNCMKMLRAKLVELKQQQHAEKISDIKGVQMKIEWGSQIRSYVFMPYQMVKDTRTGYETGNIDNVMDGDLDGFINAYLTQLATGELKK